MASADLSCPEEQLMQGAIAAEKMQKV